MPLQKGGLNKVITSIDNYCSNCLERNKECFCDRIQGYDPRTGLPILFITEEEWQYINSNQKKKGERKEASQSEDDII
jgi:hypothetical protein